MVFLFFWSFYFLLTFYSKIRHFSGFAVVLNAAIRFVPKVNILFIVFKLILCYNIEKIFAEFTIKNGRFYKKALKR